MGFLSHTQQLFPTVKRGIGLALASFLKENFITEERVLEVLREGVVPRLINQLADSESRKRMVRRAVPFVSDFCDALRTNFPALFQEALPVLKRVRLSSIAAFAMRVLIERKASTIVIESLISRVDCWSSMGSMFGMH